MLWLKPVAFFQVEPLQELRCVFRIKLPGVVGYLLELKLAQRNFERPTESSTLLPKYLQVVRGHVCHVHVLLCGLKRFLADLLLWTMFIMFEVVATEVALPSPKADASKASNCG